MLKVYWSLIIKQKTNNIMLNVSVSFSALNYNINVFENVKTISNVVHFY